MPTHSPDRKVESADLALAVYIEEVCAGRTVLWIGDSGHRAADHVGQVARQVRVQPRASSLEPSSVDVVIVPDLARVGLADPDALQEIARAVGPDGVLVAGLARDASVDYEAFFSMASGAFPSVRMLGQTPFRGYAVVDFDAAPDEQEAPTLDGSLVEGDEIERYVALCAKAPARLDAYAVIRVPATRRRRRRRNGQEPKSEAVVRLAEVEAELVAASAHAESLEVDLGARTAELEALRDKLEVAEAKRATTLDELEGRLRQERAAAIHDLEGRLDEERGRVVELKRVAEAYRSEAAAEAAKAVKAAKAADARAADAKAAEAAKELPAPVSEGPGASAEMAPAEDYERLEARLADRGRALRQVEGDLAHQAILVRDLVEELSEARRTYPTLPSDAPDRAPTLPGVVVDVRDDLVVEERERAVARALEAEAGQAESRFAVDELTGRLEAQAEEAHLLSIREAELVGRVRGLSSRLAEVQELRELADARRVLLEDDLQGSRGSVLALERELGELQDQLALEMLRGRGPRDAETLPSSGNETAPYPVPSRGTSRRAAAEDAELIELRASEARLSARVSELSGQLMAARDLIATTGEATSRETSQSLRDDLSAARGQVSTAEEERDHARAENLRLTAVVGCLENRFAGARRGYQLRIAEISEDLRHAEVRLELRGAELHDTRNELAAVRDEPPAPAVPSALALAKRDALRGELAGTRARLEDREAALTTITTKHEHLTAATKAAGKAAEQAAEDRISTDNALRDDLDALRDQVSRLKETETDLTIRFADAEELSELEANRANDLASTVAARDALVNRLQLDLADEERRGRSAEETGDRARLDNERLREALMEASERISEEEVLERRVTDLQGILHESVGREAAHGSRMDAAEDVLREARRDLSLLVDGLAADGAMTGHTSVGIDAPDGADTGSGTSSKNGTDGARLLVRISELEREVTDKDTLLRSATAQLEERGERMRTLEKQRASGSETELRQSLIDLQQRAATLSEELAHAKDARRDAEAGQSESRTEKMRTLHDTLGDRDAELLVLRGQVSSAERDIRSFRQATDLARSGLEELLGVATAGGDPRTAERVGGLLRTLSRIG